MEPMWTGAIIWYLYSLQSASEGLSLTCEKCTRVAHKSGHASAMLGQVKIKGADSDQWGLPPDMPKPDAVATRISRRNPLRIPAMWSASHGRMLRTRVTIYFVDSMTGGAMTLEELRL